MKGLVGTVVLALALGVLAGCTSIPKLQDAAIAPAQLKVGDSAVITVRVEDKHAIVKRVEGVVREDPRIKLKLHDDGQAPDVKADDRIWSLQVDVPFQAAPGAFTLDLTAYRSDGTPVPIRRKGKTGPLTVDLPLTIGAAQ